MFVERQKMELTKSVPVLPLKSRDSGFEKFFFHAGGPSYPTIG